MFQSAQGATSCVNVAASFCPRSRRDAACLQPRYLLCHSWPDRLQPVRRGLYQSLSGQTNCTTCPNAHYCIAGATAPRACPAGTYRSTDGGTSSSDCTTCPAGSACVSGSSAPVICASGSFSLAGATTCNTVPAGYYQDVAGSEQQAVRFGSYCPVGSSRPVPCPAGTVGSYQGYTSENQCQGVGRNTGPLLVAEIGRCARGQAFGAPANATIISTLNVVRRPAADPSSSTPRSTRQRDGHRS